MENIIKSPSHYCLLLLVIMLSGCGGGGSSSNSSDENKSEVFSSRLNGLAVKGLYYETETLSGMTDKHGGYQYREGELIRFSLGDTPLGSALAKEDLSAFDWLGTTPPTDESQLVSLLKGSMINSLDLVLNAASLLLSLDVDGKLENGIDLGTAHQSLLGEELDMAVKAKNFANLPSIQTLVNALVNRDLLPLKEVADQLYTNMKIPLVASRVTASNTTSAEDKGRASSVRYNQYGNIEAERVVISENDTPIDLDYEYDAENRLTQATNSYTKQTETLVYDQERLAFRFIQKDGSPTKSREIYHYNDSGQLSQLRLDSDGDGRPDRVTDLKYTESSEQVTVTETMDGKQNEFVTLTQFKDGAVETFSEDYDNDGQPELEMFYTYDEQSRMSSRLTVSTDPSIESGISYFEYDDQDRMARYSVDTDMDEVIDYIESYGYDYYDNRVAFRRDMNADNQWDYVAHYRFDSNGQRVEIKEDSDGNGVIDVHWQAELEATTVESDWDTVISGL